MNNLDKINITNLKVFAYHGVFENEKKNGQDFFINATLYLDMHKAGLSDDLSLSVNYGEVCEFITNTLCEKNFDLIEAAATYTTTKLLINYPKIVQVDFELCKPHAPVGLPFENISVKISRKWHKVYVAVGSNLGDIKEIINTALSSIKENTFIKSTACSTLITTKPYGYVDQPDFINGAICFYTLYTPNELLDYLHTLEANAKRVRNIHWGPRTLDLDILFYDDLIMYTKDLIIPHPEIEKRDFVLIPMNELNPYLIHPVLNKSIKELYSLLLA